MELSDYVKSLPASLGLAEIGKRCMQFLMRRQYGDNPPNPCPCDSNS